MSNQDSDSRTVKRNRTGMTFECARLHFHYRLGRTNPVSRLELAKIALEEYGPMENPSANNRPLRRPPDPVARWLAKIRVLEERPGLRARHDHNTRRLCDLLGIRRIEPTEFTLDLDD